MLIIIGRGEILVSVTLHLRTSIQLIEDIHLTCTIRYANITNYSIAVYSLPS